jgi:hypothetical protein
MKKRKLVKPLIWGIIAATGISMCSSRAMAAEVEEIVEESNAMDDSNEKKLPFEPIQPLIDSKEDQLAQLAKNVGLNQFLTEYKTSNESHEKIEVIDRAIAESNNNYNYFLDTHPEELDAYNKVMRARRDMLNAQSNYDTAVEWYEHLLERSKWAQEVLDSTEDGPAPYSKYCEELNNGGDAGYLWYIYAFYWGEDVRDAIDTMNSLYSATHEKEEAEKNLAWHQANYEAVKAANEEGYNTIANVENNNCDFRNIGWELQHLLNLRVKAEGITENDRNFNEMVGAVSAIEEAANDIQQNYTRVKALIDSDSLTEEDAAEFVNSVNKSLTDMQIKNKALQKNYDKYTDLLEAAEIERNNAAESLPMDYLSHYFFKKAKETTDLLEKYAAIEQTTYSFYFPCVSEQYQIAADGYMDALVVMDLVDSVYVKGQEAMESAESYSNQLIEIIDNYKKSKSEDIEETVLSDKVYTVFEAVKKVVIENPELLEKLYSYYDADDDVDIAQDVFNYIVNKLGVETVNYYAEELSSVEITPEVVNTYHDMFMDWINQ